MPRHVKSRGLGGAVMTTTRLPGDRRELTARLRHPLTPARERYLRQVLADLVSGLVIGRGQLRCECAGCDVDQVARVLASLCTGAPVERTPAASSAGRSEAEPAAGSLGPLDLGPPRRAWRQ